jgi:hypothetical protein
VVEGFAAPQSADDRDLLLRADAATSGRNAEGGELVSAVPESEAEHEPAARQGVEGGALFRDVHRVVERKHEDRGADCKRPEMRGQRGDREQRCRPVGPGVVVLLDPDGVEVIFVGEAHMLDRLGEMSRAVRGDDAELERHYRSTTQSSAAWGRVSSS